MTAHTQHGLVPLLLQEYEKEVTMKGIEYVSKDPARGRADVDESSIPELTEVFVAMRHAAET